MEASVRPEHIEIAQTNKVYCLIYRYLYQSSHDPPTGSGPPIRTDIRVPNFGSHSQMRMIIHVSSYKNMFVATLAVLGNGAIHVHA